ncbi:hypothetical protein SMICM304S_05491 [Streptomyces microflavus]
MMLSAIAVQQIINGVTQGRPELLRPATGAFRNTHSAPARTIRAGALRL